MNLCKNIFLYRNKVPRKRKRKIQDDSNQTHQNIQEITQSKIFNFH